MFKQVFVVSALLIGASLAQTVVPQCDEPEVEQNFDVASFMGLWYEIVYTSTQYWEGNATCVTANYTLNDDGTVKVWNSEVLNGERSGIEAEAEGNYNNGSC